jgi:3-hydroxymyristoyl/3-hydroxydecanoyl-(acyl carrier protein) dehydratase
MLQGKNVLVIGARSGGYGESIARAAWRTGARVFGTSLNPEDPREQVFFKELNVELIAVPLRYDFDRRKGVLDSLNLVESALTEMGVRKLDAVVHAVAGGFPRQPSVMKAVGDILKGKQTFFDMATVVKRNVYYVNAGSFEDTINGMSNLADSATQYLALTYRGDLPYFISHTKEHLERIAGRMARLGKRTLIAALPEAWTQSSQFFTGIELAVVYNYLNALRNESVVSSKDIAFAFSRMHRSLESIEGSDRLLRDLQVYLEKEWNFITRSSNADLSRIVHELFTQLRNNGTFTALRKTVEVISDFVREASGILVVREFLAAGRYQPGDVRQVHYNDLLGHTTIGLARPREKRILPPLIKRQWRYFEKDEIRQTLSMYGENFLFLDRVVMEVGEFRNGMLGFGRYTVPTPEENPILRDHFVGMPLFGGHLQMEAVAQFGTFMIMKLLKDQRLIPILTGTEFPELNTMAPPGETLTMVGVIGFTDKRDLWLEAFLENRFARSKGLIRGMVLNQRVVRKMMASFYLDKSENEPVTQ